MDENAEQGRGLMHLIPNWAQVAIAVATAVFVAGSLSAATAANSNDIKDLKAKVDPQASDIAEIKTSALYQQKELEEINRRLDHAGFH